VRSGRSFALALLIASFASLGMAGVSRGQEPCDPPGDDEALSHYLGRFAQCQEQALKKARNKADQMVENTPEMISTKPTSAAPGDGFGSQLRDGIEDFLPLFGFAIDSVSTAEDDKSVTVRLNPIRAGELGSIGLSVAATEPKPGEGLINTVPEGQRAALREIAENRLDDLSDLTYSLKWAYERRATVDTGFMFGRSVESYRPIIEGRLIPAVVHGLKERDPGGVTGVSTAGACDVKALDALDSDPQDATIAALRDALEGDFGPCLEAWEGAERKVVDRDRKLDTLSLLPYLIDNQPQLVLTGAVHDRDPLVGRDGWEVQVTYEHGFENFNSLLRRFRKARDLMTPSADEQALAEAFWTTAENLDPQAVKAENKVTFSVRYAERDQYQVSETFGEGDDAIPVSIDLPKAEDWCAKLEWHRNATWQAMKVDGEDVFPRLHLSAEYVDVSDDPQRRDRLVATLTYELPLGAETSVPLSLTYANHSEFLGEQDEQFSAHLGFSYKLPGKQKATKKKDG